MCQMGVYTVSLLERLQTTDPIFECQDFLFLFLFHLFCYSLPCTFPTVIFFLQQSCLSTRFPHANKIPFRTIYYTNACHDLSYMWHSRSYPKKLLECLIMIVRNMFVSQCSQITRPYFKLRAIKLRGRVNDIKGDADPIPLVYQKLIRSNNSEPRVVKLHLIE